MKGFIVEQDEALPLNEAAIWSLRNVAASTAASRLAESPISVTSYGDFEVEPFIEALRSMRVRVVEAGKFGVVLTDDYLRSGLDAYNKESLASERPWLLVKPVGCQIWIGPLIRPSTTACWECMARRLRANREVEMFVQQKLGRENPVPVARGFSAASLQIAWNLAANAIAEWIVQSELPKLESKIVTWDVRTWQTQTHTVVRMAQCPACGQPECGSRPASQPIMLQSRPKHFTQDGGHRGIGPEATLERYQHHISPITGAVRRLERATASDDGVMHTYVSGENWALRHQSFAQLRNGLRRFSGGKGASDVQARASCLCEALERISGVFRGDEIRRTARLQDLGDVAIHPNASMLFSPLQYQNREAMNARLSMSTNVPVVFDESVEIDWTPVWSMTRQEVRYLPTALCYYCDPFTVQERFCLGDSNGCAAGNSVEEAILQGFLELVERDGVALWWYNRIRRPGVDLDSFNDPYLHQLRDYLMSQRRDLWALDLTTDLGIPVFVAASHCIHGPMERIMFGFGAHLDPKIALLRAVTELNQMLVNIMPGDSAPKLDSPHHDSESLKWLGSATLDNQPYLVPDSHSPPKKMSDYLRIWSDDIRDDVLACQLRVENLGLNMLVLDQTRADIGLPVVKVIVPGLRHFWARFAPGRLYDVPVQLGWLPQELNEEELNPIPMFL